MFNFIADEKELKWFYEHVFVQPEIGESYMIVLSARNKALNEEERKIYGLGRSEMMRMEILKGREESIDWTHFLAFTKSFNFDETSMLTRNGLTYPNKALVVYWFIDPANELHVANELMKYITLNETELMNSYEKGNKDGVKESKLKLSKISYMSKSLHACCPSRKFYLDYDLDCDKDFLKANYDKVYSLITKYYKKGGFFINDTKGGWHILAKKDLVKFNPNLLCDDITSFVKENGLDTEKYECVVNKNGFIQLPGSVSREHIVRILNKEDFE